MKPQLKSAIVLHMKDNSSIYLFTIVLLLMGIIFGAIVVNSLNTVQKEDLFFYLSRFFGQVQDGELAQSSIMFKQSFIHYAKYLGLMWILGLSIIGLPIILILLFLKGVVVGFTVGFLVNQMGWYGFLLSFVSVLPQNFLLIPAYILVGTAAISFSLKMIRQQFLKKINKSILPSFTRYTALVVGICLILGVASAFEAYLSPALMKNVVDLIYN